MNGFYVNNYKLLAYVDVKYLFYLINLNYCISHGLSQHYSLVTNKNDLDRWIPKEIKKTVNYFKLYTIIGLSLTHPTILYF